MTIVRWEKYPSVGRRERTGEWLEMQANLGVAPNTIAAYGRALDEYLRFSSAEGIQVVAAGRAHVARWINDLLPAPELRKSISGGYSGQTQTGLANATIQQRLTAVRLFYDHLVFEGMRDQNPVGRGSFTPSRGFGSVGRHPQVRGPDYYFVRCYVNPEV